MAHALYGYDGPCKNIHGHTYHLSVTLRGQLIQDAQNPKLGMVIDFGNLKELVSERILKNYDHALVINEKAPYATMEGLFQQFEKVIHVAFQPTCEQLLLHFVDELKAALQNSFELYAVRLEETPNSFAEWCVEDN